MVKLKLKMWRLWAFLLVACVSANDNIDQRKSKLPFVADAVGNRLPPPSNGPAPVGSPSQLLTPDRYEFYTFDESGELVKRLMTLDEIQNIVAAGEGTDGHLVTFANDDQPNISYNFSQAPFTKVHSVVENVQNVLKAQMEAQKINPPSHPTLDTPDVSDSWSLILPSIFGNTGADITPDKTSNIHSGPDTDMLDVDIEENSLSKEGDGYIVSSSATTDPEFSTENYFKELTKSTTAKAFTTTTMTTTSTTTTTTTTTTEKPSTTTTTTTTTEKPSTTTSTSKPSTTTTSKPSTTTTTPKPSTTTTTPKPSTTTTTTKPSTRKPVTKPSSTTTTTTTQKVRPSISSSSPKPRTTTTSEKPSTTVKLSKISTTTHAPKLSTTTTTTTENLKIISTITQPQETEKTTTKSRVTTTELPRTASSISESILYSSTVTTKQKPTSIFQTKTSPSITSYSTTPPAAQNNIRNVSLKTTIKPPTNPSFQPSYTQNSGTTATTKRATTTSVPIKYEFKATTHLNRPTSRPTPLDTVVTTTLKTQSFIPLSTIKYVTTERTWTAITNSPVRNATDFNVTMLPTNVTSVQSNTTDSPQNSVTHFKPNQQSSTTIKFENDEGDNATTITTQSNPPSTAASITEYSSSESKPNKEISQYLANEEIVPMFDVAQSISQIATDLGNYPISSQGNIFGEQNDTINMESKESLELEIPNDIKGLAKPNETFDSNMTKMDNYVKISTIDPPLVKEKPHHEAVLSEEKQILFVPQPSTESSTSVNNIMDAILSESMGDLFLQIASQDSPKIVDSTDSIPNVENSSPKDDLIIYHKSSNLTSQNEKVKTTNKVSTRIVPAFVETSTNNNENILEQNKKPTEKPLQNSTTYKSTPYEIKDSENVKNISLTVTTTYSPINSTEPTKSLDLFNEVKITTMKTTKNDSNYMNTENINKLEIPYIGHTNNISFNKSNNVSNNNDQPKIEEFKKKIQKVNIDDKEFVNDRNSSWKLISTVKPPKANDIPKDKFKNENNLLSSFEEHKDINLDYSKENQGLEVTIKHLGDDIVEFVNLCNELAFRYWNSLIETIDKKRSFVLSPYSVTSMLAMMFMGAKGATSGEMNEILKLDDMVTFNPHFTLKNISDSIDTTPDSGVVVAAFVRELYSDRSKGRVLTFYKERAQHFYNGHVEEINFNLISDIIRRRTNLLVKRYSWGRIAEYMKSNSVSMQPPLAAFSANIFQTDCTGTSVDGRDGEMYFVVSPTVRQRRLVPVPAVVYKKGFLAGYDPVLDATAAALGNTHSVISTLFLMPGQQGNVVHADDLELLERRLLDSNPTTPSWNRLLRTLLPRVGLELQIPRYSHKSIFNVSSTLKSMGLKDLFNADQADLGGLNGPSKDLYLSDMVQMTSFATCGEGVIGEQHHIEEYPETLETTTRKRRMSRWMTSWDEPRDYQRAFHDPHDVGDAMHLPLHLRPRQARLPARSSQPARLKFDRPFLYFVRHNPSGMILYVGRYNPRLLP